MNLDSRVRGNDDVALLIDRAIARGRSSRHR